MAPYVPKTWASWERAFKIDFVIETIYAVASPVTPPTPAVADLSLIGGSVVMWGI